MEEDFSPAHVGGDARPQAQTSRRGTLALRALMLAVLTAAALPGVGAADQASQTASPSAVRIATGRYHTCAVLGGASVRCWGYGADGALGYGNSSKVGDDETPASVGPVNLGPGRTAMAISAGTYHTCSILDDGSVRCWGYGGDGRLGYGNANSVGVTQTPASAGPVDLGPGRTAKAIAAGGSHTCAILDDGSVRCWGFGFDGQLGYGNTNSIGVTQTPGSAGPVDLGPGRTAKAIAAGALHTCAILDDGSVRCWGYGANGQLGYANTSNVGDTPATTPDKVGPVDLGAGRTAVAISAGGAHTCAILDDGSVRCWGYGGDGELGYGNTTSVGDSQTPGSMGPVDLGPGRTAKAITAGAEHTCAILDDGSVRCWGYDAYGQLGYANTHNLGDTPATTPGKLGPVNIGAGHTAIAISAGDLHTCALLDDGSVRCWGYGAYGQLGYCSTSNVGQTNTPGSAGPVNLQASDGGTTCASPGPPPGGGRHQVDPLHLQALRAQALHHCLAAALGQRSSRQRSRARRGCLGRYGRTPGRVTSLHARALSATTVVLAFAAPGSDGAKAPAARTYLIKQSPGPIRGARAFLAAHALCHGGCRFKVTAVGTKIKLTITHLRPHATYHYAIAARDNVTGRLGPRSQTIAVRTR